MRAPTTAGRAAPRITSRRPRATGASARRRRCAPAANGCRSRTSAWDSYQIGDLATLFRPETRLTARSRPLDFGAASARAKRRRGARSPSSATGRGATSGGRCSAPSRRPGSPRRFGARCGRAMRWQLLAQQTVMGRAGLFRRHRRLASRPMRARRRAAAPPSASPPRAAGLPFNLDAWDGYPAARDRLLRAALRTPTPTSSSCRATATMAGRSTSTATAARPASRWPGTASPRRASKPMSAEPGPTRSPAPSGPPTAQLEWADTSRRGYLTVELTPERAIGEWLFLDTVADPLDRAGRPPPDERPRAAPTASPEGREPHQLCRIWGPGRPPPCTSPAYG